MIFVDMSQVMISNILVGLNTYAKDMELNEDLIRHMILNSLRSHRSKFHEKYGELVLCYDSPNSWRKKEFSFYKANRKKRRGEYDWNSIFQCLNKIKEELKTEFPYPFVEVSEAEADDIIAVLIQSPHLFSRNEYHLILSGDKDFVQLLENINVHQYSPVLKKFITHDSPKEYLREHIIKGDSGDGIPNILSEDDSLITGKRQKQIRMKNFPSSDDLSTYDFFNRNKKLIDLSLNTIPSRLHCPISDMYLEQRERVVPRSGLLSYFIKNNLSNLIDVIHEF